VRSRLVALLLVAVASALFAARAGAEALPDGRAYELVTPVEKNGLLPEAVAIASSGGAVDWQAPGACCGATSGAEELYQSRRGSEGWSTSALTPTPSAPLLGLLQEQLRVFSTPDLAATIFTTPASYAPGDAEDGALNLYLFGPESAVTWLSQGPLGGSGPDGATFDGATPDAETVVFSSAAQLTSNATGLSELPTPPEYLYARDLATGQTSLVDVEDGGKPVSPDGASLGDGGYLGHEDLSPDTFGTTTNALSSDGSKVFFESPPYGLEDVRPSPPSHLYMRDLRDASTTPLDDPASAGFARYDGASEDGSLVFFTSTEGLGGDPYTDPELYEANTTERQIGPAPPMSVVPVSAGAGAGGYVDGHLIGETAISNDGSHVYFAAEGVLAGNTDARSERASAGAPNFYVFDTRSGQTTFIATLAERDVDTRGEPGPLVREPDVQRPAVPTPDGSVLVFASSANLTGQNAAGPSTTLTAEAANGATTITVASTAGIDVGRTIELGNSFPLHTDSARVTAVTDATHLTLASPLSFGHEAGTAVTQLSVFELYRYSTEDGSLVCVSCVPAGVAPRGSATLGDSGGGSYGPAGLPVPMSSDGSRVFFDTADSLVAGDVNGNAPSTGPFGASLAEDVYEWEDGQVHLISPGRSTGSVLDGTTPSGEDVFFTTAFPLVPQDTDGFADIYDARVAGGFPEPPEPPPPCSDASCRPSPVPPPSFPAPASTLSGGRRVSPSTHRPSFTVSSVSASQRAALARTGRLALTIGASAAGRIAARAFAKLRGKTRRVAGTAVEVLAGGHATLSLELNRAARAALAARGTLALRIEISYSQGGSAKVLRLSLTRNKALTRSSHTERASR
jgi:hypothetical protein